MKKLTYKEEGLRRMKLRKEIRNRNYIDKIKFSKDNGVPFSGWGGGSWADSESPTGYSQVCEMGGHCESPCNGDC